MPSRCETWRWRLRVWAAALRSAVGMRARPGACANGIGADNTCTTFTLGGDQISMFGLSPDGDVDGNDTLFVGFTCR